MVINSEYTLVFVDGENLTLRYQEMLAAGRIPRPDNIHIPDCFIWNNKVFGNYFWDIKRLSYYTSVVGDDVYVKKIREIISNTTYLSTVSRDKENHFTQSGQIIPFVRKKLARSKKESICDIMIAVDVMRACYRDHADNIWLFSGDGDFIQLVEEAVHSGKRVYQSAFSSGLNDELRYVVDEFISLDNFFFLSDEEVKKLKVVEEATNALVDDSSK